MEEMEKALKIIIRVYKLSDKESYKKLIYLTLKMNEEHGGYK